MLDANCTKIVDQKIVYANLFSSVPFFLCLYQKQLFQMSYKAVAILSEKVDGIVYFEQIEEESPTQVTAYFIDLPAGKHGFHIHEFGDHSNGCTSAGAHYNPLNTTHGSPYDSIRHVGDMGNVVSKGEKETFFSLVDDSISLVGKYSVIGRSIVIHENEDDLGKGGHDERWIKDG